MKLGLAVLALLLALLMQPLAGADHVYSHRFVVEGRLMGADGLPLRGAPIQVSTQGANLVAPCSEAQRAVTDEQGDFRFCYHVHALDASALVTVRAPGANATLPIDVALRHLTFFLHDETRNGTQPPDWNDTYRIAGRVWHGGATTLEGVPVYGTALAQVAVNLTLTSEGDRGSVLASQTDGYGDYDVTIRLVDGAMAANTTVHVETLGYQQNVTLDPRLHRSAVDFALQSDAPEPVAHARPGSKAPPVSPLLLAATVLALTASFWIARRKLR
jgi:hypothetical protein